MNYRIFSLLIIFFFYCNHSFAQKEISWRKMAKMAIEYQKNNDFYLAATYYQKAYKARPDKEEYSYQAGRCFLALRDYINAIKALAPIQNKNSTFDKVGYQYALALKQAGQVEAAKKAFEAFLIDYQGEEKEFYKNIVDNEIRGCNFVVKAQEYTNLGITINHLDSKINSNKTEFAPIPFGSNILYFSSTNQGAAQIYRSQKNKSTWQLPQVPPIFSEKMEKTHFGNGSFTEDGQRFYFTQCEINDQPKCAIYMMERQGNKWTKPQILPDYINTNNTNTTHPFVVTSSNYEILYFSSTRPGGRGGLDLWYTTRDKTGGDFTLPKNLGRNINTQGDEISPFYHAATHTLYFSSNGRVSAGGLDIFKSKGEKLQWEVAQNLGFPINSSADDLYYTISESHGGGYFVSNRAFLPSRITTIDDDIFSFVQENINIEISGKITASNNISLGALTDVNIKLFEITKDNEELIAENTLEEGVYYFNLEPQTSYLISFWKEGYQLATFPIQTARQSEQLAHDMVLIPIKKEKIEPDWEKIKHEIVAAKYNANNNAYLLPLEPINPVTGEHYEGNYLIAYNELAEIAKLSSEHKLYYDEGGNPQPYRTPIVEKPIPTTVESLPEVETELYELIYNQNTLSPEGIIYKIQVAAVRKFRDYKYKELKKVGRLAIENIRGGIHRVLVVDKVDNAEGIEGFKSKGKALNVLSYILNNSVFKYAFVIKYKNGKRVGDGFRGWDEEEGLKEATKPNKKPIKNKYEGF